MLIRHERYAKAVELRAAGMTFRQIGQELGGVSRTRAHEMYIDGLRKKADFDFTNELSTRAANALRSENLGSKEEVLQAYMAGKFDCVRRGERMRPDFQNLGIKSLREIEAWLGVEPRRSEKKQASKETLARAKNMLERYGYKVVEPPSEIAK